MTILSDPIGVYDDKIGEIFLGALFGDLLVVLAQVHAGTGAFGSASSFDLRASVLAANDTLTDNDVALFGFIAQGASTIYSCGMANSDDRRFLAPGDEAFAPEFVIGCGWFFPRVADVFVYSHCFLPPFCALCCAILVVFVFF